MNAFRVLGSSFPYFLRRAPAMIGLGVIGYGIFVVTTYLFWNFFGPRLLAPIVQAAMGGDPLRALLGSGGILVATLAFLWAFTHSFVAGTIVSHVIGEKVGEPVGFGGSIGHYFGFWGRATFGVLTAGLLIVLLLIPCTWAYSWAADALFEGPGIAALLFGMGGAEALPGLGLFLLFNLPVILLVLGTTLVVQCAVIEGRDAFECIGRSWSLVKGNRVSTFLLVLAMAVWVWALTWAAGWMVERVWGPFPSLTVGAASNLVVQAVGQSFAAVVWATFYWTLRAPEVEEMQAEEDAAVEGNVSAA